jgi:uncharacterized protein
MVQYLRDNLIRGFKTPPFLALPYSLLLLLSFGLFGYFIGSRANLFEIGFVGSKFAIVLPLTLFIFPALLEEAFFRGVLIPNHCREKGWVKISIMTLLSSVLFVAWHPLNALTVNTGAQEFFLNEAFLVIVFLLGMVCSLSYILSRSLWVPIIIHWLTVLVWVLFLGGRNLVLE